jgi:S1-C subfamily serine protease
MDHTTAVRYLKLALACSGLIPARASAADLEDVIAKVESAVVEVNTDDGFGSGVIVRDGVVLTNFHVIDRARTVTIKLRSGKELAAAGFLVADPNHDLALLKIQPVGADVVLPIAPSMPRVGARVAALGKPKGFSFTTTEGIVSAVRDGKEVMAAIGPQQYHSLGFVEDTTWIQTTAPISSGNSGGPLVNMDSQLVGINTWGSVTDRQLNFAVGLNDIRRIMDSAKDKSTAQPFAALPRSRSSVAMPGMRPGFPPGVPPGMVPGMPPGMLPPGMVPPGMIPGMPPGAAPPGTVPPVRLEDFTLKLPTGRVFSFAVFTAGSKTFGRLNASGGESLAVRHANGALLAAVSYQAGLLNGPTVALYDTEVPMARIMYQKGRRHGVLKYWDESKQPVIFAQYELGKRDGFTCFFDDGELVLIGQYGNGELEYLQLMSNLDPLDGFKTEAEAEQHAEAGALLLKLEQADRKLAKSEAVFRKHVNAAADAKRRERAKELKEQQQRRDRRRFN